MGRNILDDQTLVSLNTLEDRGFLNGPFADVRPVLLGLGVFLLRMRGIPSRLPVIGKLFQERSLKLGGLNEMKSANRNYHKIIAKEPTVKVGLSTTEAASGAASSSAAWA